ncbi:MAG: leucine-rich repeat domain-containing protein [Bacteroides sp.]|nr:leucine-rich repeat domain-containing protein [Bacteroides sp.]
MNKKKIYFIFALCGLLSFTSCQNEEPLDAPVAKDALALLPADTPVGIQAQLKGGFAQGESRTTATNWYAWNEIHPTQNVVFNMYLPGAADPNKTTLGASNFIPFGSLSTTEPFSSLKLKDFNLTEGGNRCVSRWTALHADYSGLDNLYSFARLEADAQGNPVLNYGELQRADTKVTLVLKDEMGAAIAVNDGKVSAKLSMRRCSVCTIYTPAGQTKGVRFIDYMPTIQTLADDAAIDPEGFGCAVFSFDGDASYSLAPMMNASGSEYSYGVHNNMLTTILPATPTHTTTNRVYYTPIENPQLTDAEVLTIEVNTDPDGDGPLTTGKYTLKLKDVKLADGTNLTALKSGEHLTLTVTLQHNMLVEATATIGGWDEVRADVDLNQDPSKIPPYEYKEADNTYYINLEEGLELVLADRMANNHTDASIVYEDVTYEAVVSGTETDLAAAIGDKTTIIFTGTGTGTEIANITSFIYNGPEAAYTLLMPNVTTVENETFYGCASLAGISLPAATSVGNSAFLGCTSLVSVSLPAATSVGQAAFYGCTSLVSVSLPAATTVENETFYGCTSLAGVSLPKATTIGKDAFLGCVSLASVSLPKATNIGENVFYGCTSLAGVSLPKATTIGGNAFYGCTSLTTLTFGSVITEVGSGAFYNVGNGVGNCALTLASGQQHIEISPTGGPSELGNIVNPAAEDADVYDRIWADYTWKSITIK